MKSRTRNDAQWKGIPESVEDLGRFWTLVCFCCNYTSQPASLGNVEEGEGGRNAPLASHENQES